MWIGECGCESRRSGKAPISLISGVSGRQALLLEREAPSIRSRETVDIRRSPDGNRVWIVTREGLQGDRRSSVCSAGRYIRQTATGSGPDGRLGTRTSSPSTLGFPHSDLTFLAGNFTGRGSALTGFQGRNDHFSSFVRIIPSVDFAPSRYPIWNAALLWNRCCQATRLTPTH